MWYLRKQLLSKNSEEGSAEARANEKSTIPTLDWSDPRFQKWHLIDWSSLKKNLPFSWEQKCISGSDFSLPCFPSTLQRTWAGWAAPLIQLAYLCGRKKLSASVWKARKVFIWLKENIQSFFKLSARKQQQNQLAERGGYLWAFYLNSLTESLPFLKTDLCYSLSGDADCGHCAVQISTKDSLLCMLCASPLSLRNRKSNKQWIQVAERRVEMKA